MKLTEQAKLIRAAGRLILDRERRTRGASARVSRRGESVDAKSKEAKFFCAEGAIARVCPENRPLYELVLQETIRDHLAKKFAWARYLSSLLLNKELPRQLCTMWDEARTYRQDIIAREMANFEEYEP